MCFAAATVLAALWFLSPIAACAALIAHYDFEEGSGTLTTDAAGGGDNGTLVNGASFVIGARHGEVTAHIPNVSLKCALVFLLTEMDALEHVAWREEDGGVTITTATVAAPTTKGAASQAVRTSPPRDRRRQKTDARVPLGDTPATAGIRWLNG